LTAGRVGYKAGMGYKKAGTINQNAPNNNRKAEHTSAKP
jgi:hypothetical protein